MDNPFLRELRSAFMHTGLMFRLVALAFILLTSFTLFYALAYVIDNVTKPATQSELIGILIFQGVLSVGMFVIPSLLFQRVFQSESGPYFRFGVPRHFFLSLLTILAVLAALPVVGLLAYTNSLFPFQSWAPELSQWMQSQEDQLLFYIPGFLQEAGWLVTILVVAVIPALGEELFFRGIIQNLFLEKLKNYHLAIWLAAILFSAFHVQFLTFLPRVFLGAIMGYLLVYTGNLWYPVLAHFVNNLAGLLFIPLGDQLKDNQMVGWVSTDAPQPFAVVVSIVLLVLIWKAIISRKESEL